MCEGGGFLAGRACGMRAVGDRGQLVRALGCRRRSILDGAAEFVVLLLETLDTLPPQRRHGIVVTAF